METLLQQLTERCSDSENMKLKELYGAKKSATLTKVARTAFTRLENMYENNEAIYNWIQDDIARSVNKKLRDNARDVVRLTQFLDEEYEKELEFELEENRQVCRAHIQIPLKPHFNILLKKFFTTNDKWNVFEELKAEKIIEPLPPALQHAQLFSLVEPELNAWDQNLWVIRDFRSVVELNADTKDDEYLRPVWWIVRVMAEEQQRQKNETFILISTFECNKLISRFRKNNHSSVLHMFSAKLSQSQCTLINNKALQIPSIPTAPTIPMHTFVQLSMFAGSMYFENAEEQSAYCSFMGMIPRPRTDEQQYLFESGYINNNGYVPLRYRDHFPDLMCRFKENPDKITIGIIERRHGYSRKRSHVSQIIVEAK